MATVDIGDNTGDDFSGTEDTKLKSTEATTNYGSEGTTEVTKYEVGNHSHTIMKFSGISNLPGALNVSSSTLYLYRVPPGHDYNITAKVLNRNWVEGEATWNIYSTGNSWTTAGGLHETDDRSSTTTFDILSDDDTAYIDFSSAQLAADVEDFADGSLSNYGWHIARTGVGEDGEYQTYVTSDGDDGKRPYLSVTYTEAGGGSPGVVLLMDHFNGGFLNG